MLSITRKSQETAFLGASLDKQNPEDTYQYKITVLGGTNDLVSLEVESCDGIKAQVLLFKSSRHNPKAPLVLNNTLVYFGGKAFDRVARPDAPEEFLLGFMTKRGHDHDIIARSDYNQEVA